MLCSHSAWNSLLMGGLLDFPPFPMRFLPALLWIVPLLALSAPHGWSQQNGRATDIYLKHQEAIVEDLSAYLDQNPEAPDREAALLFLVNTLNGLNRRKETLNRYEELFQLMAKRQSVSLSMVESMVQLYAETGQRDKGLKLVFRVGGMFPDQARDPQFQQFLYQLENQLRRPLIGETLEIEFTDINGKEVSLAKMKGKVALVHFWASDDPTSMAQIQDLAKLRRVYGCKGFEIIGISLDIDKERLRQVIRDRNITWPQFHDGRAFDGKFTDRYEIRFLPASYLIGKDGAIIKVDVFGPRLELLLETLLE